MTPLYLSPIANHLWQSTLFAVAAGLLTLVLRNNRAPVRYCLWLAASVKFLVPFSLLVMAGSQFEFRTAPAAMPIAFPALVNGISQPFLVPASTPLLTNVRVGSDIVPTVLICAWFGGFLFVTLGWARQWRRIRAAVRSASPLNLDLPIRAVSSAVRMEPGVFGILRPILVLPQGIMEQLTPGQWEAILAHELCHVRRRDNLTAALHMLVEAVFWFYPLVWWIGRRLVDERERACDEAVLLAATDPGVYAEGILNVCSVCLDSPLVCVSGVGGSNLKKRIRAIMMRPVAGKLDFTRKLMLAAAGIAAIGGPVWFGLANAPQGRAQSKAAIGAPVTFEVASVKPADRRSGDVGLKGTGGGGPGTAFEVEHGRLTATNMNLFGLIVKAYGVTGCRPLGGGTCPLLSGGPDWLRKDGFDITAKMPNGSSDYTLVQLQNGRAPDLQRMLQALLAERFHLKIHHETKQVSVYALTNGKKAPKFTKADDSGESALKFLPSVQLNGLEMIQLVVKNSSMQELADFYSKFMDRPVLDKTGLKERFDFTLDYEANADAPGPFGAVTGPGLFKAFQEVGLKLEATKGPVEALVIDHAERPSEKQN